MHHCEDQRDEGLRSLHPARREVRQDVKYEQATGIIV